jgi:hypothetical protein
MSDFTNFQQTSAGPVADEPSRSSTVINRPGGVMEVRVSPEALGYDRDPVAYLRQPSIQTNVGGVTTINVGPNSATSRFSPGFQQFSTADLTGGHSDFLATARNNGIPAMGRLTPDSVVNYQGMEVALSQLESLGIVQRTTSGSYEATDAGQQLGNANGSHEAPEQAKQGFSEDLFPEAVEVAVAEAIAPIPQPLYDRAMATALANGVDAINFNEIAYNSGMTPEQARKAAELVMKAFEYQAEAVVQGQGFKDTSDFWDWARTEQREQHDNAMRMMVFGRQTSPLRQLVKQYADTVAPTDGALTRGGFEVRTAADGERLINYKGMWMTPESATRAGLI